MNDDELMKLTGEVMSDHNYQNINAKTVDIWLLLCACQAMQIAPGLHDGLRQAYRDLGKRLQSIVVTLHPNVNPLAEMGWNRDFDWQAPYVSEDGDDDIPGFDDIPY